MIKIINKTLKFFKIKWLLTIIIIVCNSQVVTAHEFGINIQHALLHLNIKTNYAYPSDFDSMVMRIVQSDRPRVIQRALALPVGTTPNELETTGVEIFQQHGFHNGSVRISVTLRKGFSSVAQREILWRSREGVEDDVTLLFFKPEFELVREWDLDFDLDQNGFPSVGDRLQILSHIVPISGDIGGNGEFFDEPGSKCSNLRLIPGSVKASHGKIISGNHDKDYQVIVANIKLGKKIEKAAKISYLVEILPIYLCSQGEFSFTQGGNLLKRKFSTARFLSDDKETIDENDATLIPYNNSKNPKE